LPPALYSVPSLLFRRQGAVLLLPLERVIGREQGWLYKEDHRPGFFHLIQDRQE